MRHFITMITFLLSSVSALATWTSTLLNLQLVHQQAEYRMFKLKNEDNHLTLNIHLIILNPNQYQATLVDQHKPVLPWMRFLHKVTVAKTTKAHHAFLGINAGYFTPQLQPLGLLKINNEEINPIIHSNLLSGFVFINASGQISIHHKNTDYKTTLSALQTGPFIIRNGNISIKGYANKLPEKRTVLALTKSNQLIVIHTSEIDLYDLANILNQANNLLDIPNIITAINLDGGSSSSIALFLPERFPIILPELSPVRDVIVFQLRNLK